MGLRYRSINPAGCFFATTSVLGRVKRFNSTKDYEMIETNIEFYRKRECADIFAYVLMPSHFHLIISIPENKSISNFMRDLKRRTAREYFESYNLPNGRLWEGRFDDVTLYSEKNFLTKLNYIHLNPVKAGLVEKPEDWLYSSARFYMFDEIRIINLTAIEF
jgi:putative transposase